MKDMKKRAGQIAMPFLIGAVVAAASATFTAITYVQAQVNPLQSQMQSLQDYQVKQTALMVLIAEHDGIPTSEVNQLLSK